MKDFLQPLQNYSVNVNAPYELRALSLGLTQNDLRGHDWSNAYISIKYLREQTKGITIQDAMNNIRGCSDHAILLKLKEPCHSKFDEIDASDYALNVTMSFLMMLALLTTTLLQL